MGDDLRLNATLNKSGFSAGLSAIRQEAKQAANELSGDFTKSFSSLGGRVAGGIGAFFGFEALKSSLDGFLGRASGLREVSEQLEMGADQTQKWQQAVDKLGLSWSGFQNVLTSINQKRIESLTDPKAASLFERLGIDRKSVVDFKGVDASDFARRVLGTRGSGEDQERALAEIISKRGLKYTGAASRFGSSEVPISEDSMEIAHKIELDKKKSVNVIDKIWSGFLGALSEIAAHRYEFGISPRPPRGSERFSGPQQGVKRAIHGAIEDPLESLITERHAEIQDRIDASEKSLRDVQRQRMSRGPLRMSLEQELLRARRHAEDIEGRIMPKTLTSDLEKSEWRAQNTIALNAAKSEEEQIRNRLLEKPLSVLADAHSKLGLFSRGAIAGAGIGSESQILQRSLHVQMEMNGHLRRIASTDAHAP